MISTKKMDTAKCPQCHQESPLEMWTIIDAQHDPILREQIFDGSLFAWQCEHCGNKIGVLNDLIYLDGANRFVVALNRKNRENAIPIENWPEIKKENYDVFRVVHSFLGLCEKMVCFENGRNDRALELFKLLLISQMENDDVDYFVYEGEDESGLLMRAWKDGKQQGLFAAPPDLYIQMEERMEQSGIEDATDQLECIDQQWAMHFMRERFAQVQSS